MKSRSNRMNKVRVKDALFTTMNHFFPSFYNWLRTPGDPRVEEKIVYPLPFLLWAVIIIFLGKVGARRQINFLLNTPEVVSNINGLSKTKLEDMAHDTTIANLLERINPEEISGVITKMINRLIRMRCLEKFRLLARYYLITIDATGLMTFKERHCEHCLVRKENGIPLYYYHNVLEAKLITFNGMALSVMTEFIENEGENSGKQDCELKAFHRLAGRLKKAFPQLPVCLLMDSLYPGEPVFDICRRNNWKFIITFKEGSMSAFYEDYLFYERIGRSKRIFEEKEDMWREFHWANDIKYKDNCRLNLLGCDEARAGTDGNTEKTRHLWITNLKIGENNYKQIAEGGRLRWKIENEGFNMQKNGGYDLEHAYSLHPTAMKNFYLLMQIAHTINQLIEKGNLLGEQVQKGFGSIRNVARKLLEELRTKPIEPGQLETAFSQPVQIRLAPDSYAPP